MHEWALAEGVISTTLRTAEEQGLTKVTAINIMMGELQQIDVDLFKFALKEIIQPQKSVIAEAEIKFIKEDAVLKCRSCKNEWAFSPVLEKLNEEERESIHFVPEIAHVYISCPICQSPDFEFIKGRGVWLDSIEGY